MPFLCLAMPPADAGFLWSSLVGSLHLCHPSGSSVTARGVTPCWVWERGSSESVKAGQAELEAAPALEFGGVELLPWHQPSWRRGPAPSRVRRANAEHVLLATVPRPTGSCSERTGDPGARHGYTAGICLDCLHPGLLRAVSTLLPLPGLGCLENISLCLQSKQKLIVLDSYHGDMLKWSSHPLLDSPSVACVTQPARIVEETGACWQGLAWPCMGAAPGAVTPGHNRGTKCSPWIESS